MRYRSTHRFDAAVLAAVALVVLGVILGSTELVIAAGVPVVYLAIGAFTGPPSVSSMAIERSFDPELPAPGQRTTVTVTVHNEGNRALPDVRVVDRLPEQFSVVEGAARGCLSVPSNGSATLSYEVVASQGDHEFEAPLVRLRPLPAVGEVTGCPPVDGDTVLRCRRTAGDIPRVRGALQRVGTQPTDRPGEGLEFHSVREYRHGDSIGRVDWRRLAKAGELSTVNFRETNATKTVIAVDGRASGHCARAEGYPTATELSAYAADRVSEQLLAAGNEVGLTALGVSVRDVEATVPSDRADRPWVPVDGDAATRTRIEAVLDAVVAAGQENADPTTAPATDGGIQPAETVAIRERLPRKADVVFVTPALDDTPLALVEALSAGGHHVLVVSPDITGAERAGSRVAGIERQLRIRRLRESDATVVDWDTTRPLAAALEATQ